MEEDDNGDECGCDHLDDSDDDTEDNRTSTTTILKLQYVVLRIYFLLSDH